MKPILLIPAVMLVSIVALLTGGCSVRRMAINQIADAVSGSGGTYGADNDSELVREAIPFGLKTMEALAAEVPDHRGLLLALSSGFTQYGYGFIVQDADEIEPQDLAKSTALRSRATKLFLRGRDWGLRGLEVSHPGFGVQVRNDARNAAAGANTDDLPLLYWTGVAWAAAITINKSDPRLMVELPTAAALLERALELDEAWDDGTLHEFFIAYDGGRPAAMGGSAIRAREHFTRAVELSGGLRASPYVTLAETVAVAEQNRTEFYQLLDRALLISPDRKPEWRLMNLIIQQKARRLKERADDLFP
jgi:predicted anti-sigma-YlaC factor YlaD